MMSRRRKRARKKIALRELLAAALSQMLPQAERDELRAAKVPAKRIISLFTPDHVILHAFYGVDRWFNLTMTRRGPELKAKDNADTSIVAKTDRVSEGQREHLQVMARKLVGPSPFADMDRGSRGRSRWAPGRKLQSRNNLNRGGEREPARRN